MESSWIILLLVGGFGLLLVSPVVVLPAVNSLFERIKSAIEAKRKEVEKEVEE